MFSHFNIIQHWRLWVLLPLLALAVDIYLKPTIVSSFHAASVPDIAGLTARKELYLGRLEGNEVYVSLGHFQSHRYLKTLAETHRPPLQLVMSHFVVKENLVSQLGSTGKTLERYIAKIDQNKANAFSGFLKGLSSTNVGEVRKFDVSADLTDKASPLDTIIVAVLPRQLNSNNYRELVGTSLEKAEKLARQGTLLLPTLGLGPRFRPSQPAAFFEMALQRVSVDATGRHVVLLFYSRWPTSYLKANIGDLNRIWTQFTDKPLYMRLTNPSLRSALLFLAVCLFTSSFSAPLTLKNAFLIFLSYMGSAFVAIKLIDFFLSGYGGAVLFYSKIIVQFTLAVFFSFISKLDPKGIFDQAAKS